MRPFDAKIDFWSFFFHFIDEYFFFAFAKIYKILKMNIYYSIFSNIYILQQKNHQSFIFKYQIFVRVNKLIKKNISLDDFKKKKIRDLLIKKLSNKHNLIYSVGGKKPQMKKT